MNLLISSMKLQKFSTHNQTYYSYSSHPSTLPGFQSKFHIPYNFIYKYFNMYL